MSLTSPQIVPPPSHTRLVLLMLVTPRDLGIAHFCIRSLSKAARINGVFVYVYCNGLSVREEEHVRNLTKNLKNVETKSNTAIFLPNDPSVAVGSKYITEAGRTELREGPYENCGEVWERELLLLPSVRYVGIIDADFEILDASFIGELLDAMDSDEKVGFASTDFGETQSVFESYSQQNCVLMARYHTWFCLYRKKCLEMCSDFSYYEEFVDGVLRKYDHSARLQKLLIEEHGFHGLTLAQLDSGPTYKYIHMVLFLRTGVSKAALCTPIA